MLGTDTVDEELERGFGLTVERIEPFLRVGGNAAEMKFMECCRYLWQADGAELTEPFIDAAKRPSVRAIRWRRTTLQIASRQFHLPHP